MPMKSSPHTYNHNNHIPYAQTAAAVQLLCGLCEGSRQPKKVNGGGNHASRLRELGRGSEVLGPDQGCDSIWKERLVSQAARFIY